MSVKKRNLLITAAAMGLVVFGLWQARPRSLGGPGDSVIASLPASPIEGRTEALLVPVRQVPLPTGSNSMGESAEARIHGPRITGQVTSDDPTLDLTKVRVAATPAADIIASHFAGKLRRLNPARYGWVIGSCDAEGRFALEEGLDLEVQYHVTAAGHGAVSRTNWGTSVGAGDEVTLPVETLFGIEVLFVDELQRTWQWPDRSGPPCGIHVNGPHDAASRPSPVALALHGLPSWVEGTGMLRCYRMGDGDRRLTIYAYEPHDQPRLAVPERLEPVRHGLRRIKQVVPGAGIAYPPVTVVIPEGLLELMLGDQDRLSIRWMVEFSRQDTSTNFGFRPCFERGKNTWTTTSLPPGKYTARFHITMNLLAGLSMSPDAKGFCFREELELSKDGTTLYVPNVSYATVEVTELAKHAGKHASFANATLTGSAIGSGKQFARFEGPPYRIPVLWDAEKHPQPSWEFALSVPIGPNGPLSVLSLVGQDGSETLELRHGQNVRVTPRAAAAEVAAEMGPEAVAR